MIIVNCVPGGRENERQMFYSQEINSSSLGWCLGPPTDVQSAEDVFALHRSHRKDNGLGTEPLEPVFPVILPAEESSWSRELATAALL